MFALDTRNMSRQKQTYLVLLVGAKLAGAIFSTKI